jgi:hypothetical protein
MENVENELDVVEGMKFDRASFHRISLRIQVQLLKWESPFYLIGGKESGSTLASIIPLLKR